MAEGLTPEEWGEKIWNDAGAPAWTLMQIADGVRLAMAQAHAEGRAEGLEEAAALCESMDYDLDSGPGFILDCAAIRIRKALAGQPSGDAKEPGNGCGKKHFGCHCVLCRADLERGDTK